MIRDVIGMVLSAVLWGKPYKYKIFIADFKNDAIHKFLYQQKIKIIGHINFIPTMFVAHNHIWQGFMLVRFDCHLCEKITETRNTIIFLIRFVIDGVKMALSDKSLTINLT